MTQEDLNTFSVDTGEVVTITIEAHGVAETVVAAKDGAPLNTISTGPLKYRFTITQAPGMAHFCIFEYVFPGGPDDDAAFTGSAKKFVTKVSSGNDTFDGPTVTPDTKVKAQNITFNVN